MFKEQRRRGLTVAGIAVFLVVGAAWWLRREAPKQEAPAAVGSVSGVDKEQAGPTVDHLPTGPEPTLPEVDALIQGEIDRESEKGEAAFRLSKAPGDPITDVESLRKALSIPPVITVVGSGFSEETASALLENAGNVLVPMLQVLSFGTATDITESERNDWGLLWGEGKTTSARTLVHIWDTLPSGRITKLQPSTLKFLLLFPGGALPAEFDGQFAEHRLKSIRESDKPIVILSIDATGADGVTSAMKYVLWPDDSQKLQLQFVGLTNYADQ